MAAALKQLQGRFILSVNDVPELRELFGWASIDGVEHTYGLSSGAIEARELVITTSPSPA